MDIDERDCSGGHADSQQQEIDRLTRLVIKGYEIVNDFMPNIGKCALQDYRRLNEFCLEARALARLPQTTANTDRGEQI